MIVVFDLDNTLVHSQIDFLGIRRYVIARLIEAGALAEPPSDPRVRSIPEWLAFAEQHDARLGAALWERVDAFEREGMLAGRVEPDARPALDALRSHGHRLAVLTNNSAASATAALDRFDLRQPLELVLARGGVPELKPGGGGVAHAHRLLGKLPLVVVGDSYIDGLAAQRSGVNARFTAFRPNLADMEVRGVRPWAIIQRLAELPELLAQPG